MQHSICYSPIPFIKASSWTFIKASSVVIIQPFVKSPYEQFCLTSDKHMSNKVGCDKKYFKTLQDFVLGATKKTVVSCWNVHLIGLQIDLGLAKADGLGEEEKTPNFSFLSTQ